MLGVNASKKTYDTLNRHLPLGKEHKCTNISLCFQIKIKQKWYQKHFPKDLWSLQTPLLCSMCSNPFCASFLKHWLFSPSCFSKIYIHNFASLEIKLGNVKESKSRGRKRVEKWMCVIQWKGTEECQESGPVSIKNGSRGLKILRWLWLLCSSQAKLFSSFWWCLWM